MSADLPSSSRHLFVVEGAASPDLPLRILNMFAQQDLAFDCAEVVRGDAGYRISVALHDLSDARAGIILHKMRVMAMVERAELSS
jgi:hypothetical protein